MEADVGKALSAILGELEQLRQQQSEVVHELAERLDRLEHLAVRQDGGTIHHRQSSFFHDQWQALGGMPDMLAFSAPACRPTAVGAEPAAAAAAAAAGGLRSNPWLPEPPPASEMMEDGSFCLKAGYPRSDSETQPQAPELRRVESRSSLFRAHHAYSSNDLYRTSLLAKQCETADALERANCSSAGAVDGGGAAVAANAAAGAGGQGVSAGAARVGGALRASSDEEDGWDTFPEERPQQLARIGHVVAGYLWGLLLPEQRAPWDMLIMVLVLWVVLATPILVCFTPPERDPGLTAVEWVDLFVDIAFTADIWFNFRTAYISSEGRLVKNRLKIAKKYLSTWFIVDLLSVLPFAALFGSTGSNLVGLIKLARIARMGKVLRLLKIMRMVRVVRLPRLINALEMKLDGAMVRVIAGMAVVLLVIHISGCLFFYMAVVEVEQAGPATPTWVKMEGLQNATIPYQYLTSIYWAATTLTTVGYGDVHPVGSREKVLGMLVMVLGPFLAGYITSSIATVMNIRNTTSAHVAAKKQRARDFARHWSLPKPLALRLHNFFEYAAERDVARSETALLKELPLRMRLRLLGQLYAGLLVGIPAFRSAPIEFLQQLVGLMEVASYSKEDLVVLQGDPGGTLYFVAEGKLEVRQYEFDPVVDPDGLWQVASHGEDLTGHLYRLNGVLRQRSFFGAVSAVCRCPWVATVVAVEGSQLYSLAWERMQVLFADWPEVAQAFYRTTIGPFWVQPPGEEGCSQGGNQPPPNTKGGGTGTPSAAAADKAAVAGVLQPGGHGEAKLDAAAEGGGSQPSVSLETRLLMWDFPMMVRVKRSKKTSAYGQLYKAASILLYATGLSSAPPAESPEPSMHHAKAAGSKYWPYQQVLHGYSHSDPQQGSYQQQQQQQQEQQQQQQDGQELVAQLGGRAAPTQSSWSSRTADSAGTSAAVAGAAGGGRSGPSSPPGSPLIKQAAAAGISGGLLKVPSAKGSLAAAAAAASAAATAAAAAAAAGPGGGEEAGGEGGGVRSGRSSLRKSTSSQGAIFQQQEPSSSSSSPSRAESGAAPGGAVSRLTNLARGMLGSRASSSRHVTADIEDMPGLGPLAGRGVGPAAAGTANEEGATPPSAVGEADIDSNGPSRASASGVWLASTGPSMYSSLGGNSFNVRSRGSSWGGAGGEEHQGLSRSVSRSRSSTWVRGMPMAPAPPVDYLDGLMTYPAAAEALPGGGVSPSMYSSGRPTLEEARLRFRQLADRATSDSRSTTTGTELLTGVMGAPAHLLSLAPSAMQRGLAGDAAGAGSRSTEPLDTSYSSGGAPAPLLGWPGGTYTQQQQQQQRRSSSVQALGDTRASPLAGGSNSAGLLNSGSSRRWTMERRQE